MYKHRRLLRTSQDRYNPHLSLSLFFPHEAPLRRRWWWWWWYGCWCIVWCERAAWRSESVVSWRSLATRSTVSTPRCSARWLTHCPSVTTRPTTTSQTSPDRQFSYSPSSLSLSLSLYGCVCASVYLARRLKSLIYHFNHLIKQKLTSSSLMFCSSVLELQSVKVMITVL